jgi:hypothetical protein
VASISGGSVLSLRAYLEKRRGKGGFERVLAEMPADLAAPLRGIILPVSWYPAKSFVTALETAARVFDHADLFDDYGSFAAEFEINAFQKVALRFTSPLYLLDRAGRMWRRFHDTGEWQVEGTATRMRGTLRHFAIVNASYCRVLAAWLHRAGEMTGVRGEVIHPHCRARGADACVFVGHWR